MHEVPVLRFTKAHLLLIEAHVASRTTAVSETKS